MKKIMFLLLGSCSSLFGQFSFSVQYEPKLKKFNKVLVKLNDDLDTWESVRTGQGLYFNRSVKNNASLTFKLDKLQRYTIVFMDTTQGYPGMYHRSVTKLKVGHGEVLKLTSKEVATSMPPKVVHDEGVLGATVTPAGQDSVKNVDFQFLIDEKAVPPADLAKYVKANFSPTLKRELDSLKALFQMILLVEVDGSASSAEIWDNISIDRDRLGNTKGYVKEIERLIAAFNKLYTWKPGKWEHNYVRSKIRIELAFGPDQ